MMRRNWHTDFILKNRAFCGKYMDTESMTGLESRRKEIQAAQIVAVNIAAAVITEADTGDIKESKASESVQV